MNRKKVGYTPGMLRLIKRLKKKYGPKRPPYAWMEWKKHADGTLEGTLCTTPAGAYLEDLKHR